MASFMAGSMMVNPFTCLVAINIICHGRDSLKGKGTLKVSKLSNKT
jgi:hypothetical protein